MQTKFEYQQIPLLDLANGMYLIEVRASGPNGFTKQQKKIIVYK